ncbi:hypothetical protein, partial [Thiolapillus sp.]|uniref:hypothetical protein n=2 Tax=Thiolapillus sp. TaxID=2017437 RepID=UPI003AF80B35
MFLFFGCRDGKKPETEPTAVNLSVSHTLCTLPSGRTQLASAKLSVCFCLVRGFEEDSFGNLHSILFCIIKKHLSLSLSLSLWGREISCELSGRTSIQLSANFLHFAHNIKHH